MTYGNETGYHCVREIHKNAPEDHLSSLARTENNLPLQLVALRDAEILHGADRALIHVYSTRERNTPERSPTRTTYPAQRPTGPHNAPPGAS